jgi:DNA polymerase elongation subunit (family B)
MIEYIIIDHTGKRKPEKAKPLALYAFEDGYDIDKYTELAIDAAATLLEPLGYNAEELRRELALDGDKKPRRRRLPEPAPEFEF